MNKQLCETEPELEEAEFACDQETISDIEAIPVLNVKGNKFRYSGQRLLLTYKTHINKEYLITHINESTGIEPKFIRAAHEIGKAKGVPYEHTHLLIDFGGRFQCQNARRFDFLHEDGEIIHPNWRAIKTRKHFDRCKIYIAKEDQENQDLLDHEVSFVDKVWNCANVHEALAQFVKFPSDVSGIITLYRSRPAPEMISILEDPRPWQKYILDLIQSEPDGRTVHWFVDQIGGVGKSALARHMMINQLAYVVRQCGGSHHFANVVKSAIESGWNQRCMIFDLPRKMEDKEIYGPIEEVCDGCVTALKYEGGTHLFNPPHVLVFANFLPNTKALSKDRWRVHRILPDTFDLDTVASSDLGQSDDKSSEPPLTLKGGSGFRPIRREDNVTPDDIDPIDLVYGDD